MILVPGRAAKDGIEEFCSCRDGELQNRLMNDRAVNFSRRNKSIHTRPLGLPLVKGSCVARDVMCVRGFEVGGSWPLSRPGWEFTQHMEGNEEKAVALSKVNGKLCH